MTPIKWMVAGCVGSCLAALVLLGGTVSVEVPMGMLGPLTAAVGTRLLVARAHRQDPAGVTAVMLSAFAVKVVFFSAYVVVALAVLDLRPVPFIVSFTTYFVSLYVVEALLLSRLFDGRMRAAR